MKTEKEKGKRKKEEGGSGREMRKEDEKGSCAWINER